MTAMRIKLPGVSSSTADLVILCGFLDDSSLPTVAERSHDPFVYGPLSSIYDEGSDATHGETSKEDPYATFTVCVLCGLDRAKGSTDNRRVPNQR